MIPPAAAAGTSSSSTVNITLAVTHTCLSSPWYATVSFELSRVDPQLVRDSGIGVGGIQACPDFVLQYSALLGSCPLETVVVATFANGSALPPYVAYAYANGVLTVVGTVPTGTPPFDIVAVALLGNETFPSANPTTVTLAPPDNIQIVPSQTSLQACPYVNAVFTVTRGSSCGQLKFRGTLSNGSAMPSFLSLASSAGSGGGTVTVSGRVPDNYPDFSIMVSATTGASSQVSNPVTITRPQDVSSANVSLRIGSVTNSSSTKSSPIQITALYGTDLRVTVAIDGGSQKLCSSLSLAASVLDPDLQQAPILDLPSWASVTRISTTSILITLSPTSDIPSGTVFVLYVWANDDKRNPGFNITFVTQMSLRRLTTATGASTIPVIDTPASLLEMQLVVNGSTTVTPVFVCPTSAVAAFCSVGADAGSLGAFGTPAGINNVLQTLSISLPTSNISSSDNLVSALGTDVDRSNITLRLTLKESANPIPLVIHVPLSAFQIYMGVTQAKALVLTGTVGKLRLDPIAQFFRAGAGITSVTYILTSNASWLTIQGEYIGGIPPSPPVQTYFTVTARDAYTQAIAKGVVNVSWPLPPVANPPTLNRWYFQSGTQVDVLLPADVITDPQNGTIAFDLQLYTGSSILQPLPLFLSFDANNLRMSGTPLAADVGVYPLVLTGTSHWGSWKGNSSVLLTITVTRSWSDFFAWIYTIIGYCISGLGSLTAGLVYRALIINVVMFRKRSRKAPPRSLCLRGVYKLEYPIERSMEEGGGDASGGGGAGAVPKFVHAVDVKAIFAIWVKEPPKTSRWYHSDYLQIHNRLAKTKTKPELLTGPVWMRADLVRATHKIQHETVDIVLNIVLLQQLVAAGRVLPQDEYYVEVVRRGRWLSGTIIETFSFTVSDVLDAEPPVGVEGDDQQDEFLIPKERGGGVGRGNDRQDSSPDNELVLMLQALSTRLHETENDAAEMKRRLLWAEHTVAVPTLRPNMALERRPRLDPYTGLPLLLYPDVANTDDDVPPLPLNSDGTSSGEEGVDMENEMSAYSSSSSENDDNDEEEDDMSPPSMPPTDEEDEEEL